MSARSAGAAVSDFARLRKLSAVMPQRRGRGLGAGVLVCASLLLVFAAGASSRVDTRRGGSPAALRSTQAPPPASPGSGGTGSGSGTSAPTAGPTSFVPYASGDVFVGGGTSSGGSISHYNASGTLVDSLSTGVTYQVTGMCFNSVGDLYATNFSNFSATRFDDSGHILQNPWVSIFTGRFESCVVDRFGNVYLSRVDSVGGNQLTKYDPSGALLGTWTPAGENRGIDWVDLSGDQCTMLYTSEGGTVKAFNVCTGTQLADFATGLGGPCYQLRIRPNGEVLVACAFKIVRLSTTGSVLQTYLASTYGETNQFALSIDPTDTVMWTGDLTSADVLKIDIASGAQLLKFTNAQGAGIGVAVYGSPSAGIPVGPPPGAPPPEATYGPCDQASRWWQNSERVRAACRAAANDPVNLATGAVSSSMTDASLPSIGELFKFTRSYTSLDTNTGELGAGWTDNYADRLTIVTGLITWRSGSGAQVVFTQQPDTTYKAPVWTTATLTASGGGYEAVTPGQTHYTFDSQGRLTGVKDRNAKGVTLAYDAQGLRSTLTDSAGRVVTFSHNADGTLSRITLPDSRFVQYGYTSGRLTTVTDLRSGTYTYGYDTAGRLQSETDQNLHRLVFNTYGPDGRISQQLDGNNNPTLFAWDAPSQTATVTDARLNQWKSVFNGTLLVSQTDPLGGKVRYGYDPGTGDLTLYVDALGQAEQMSYDSRHNRLTRTAPAPLSYKETWTYNTFNDSLSYKDGRLNQTDYGYDTAGNLTTVQGPDPDGGGVLGRPLTTYTRDPAGTGLIVAKIDPRQKTTQYAYDPTTHALSQITTPLGEKTTFTYEANSGRLKTSVEPRGNVTGGNPADYTTSYTYDNADHLITLTSDPDGGGPQLPLVKQWLYDPAGNLQTLTDENTHATDYGYDPANHLMTVTAPDPDGGGPLLRPVTSYTYDEVGNLKTRSVAAGTHTTTYMYDSANRLQSVSSPTNQLWTYTYDADGNRVTQIDPNGNSTPTVGDGKTTYGYDALGRLSTISYSDTTPAVSFLYDANGNRTQTSDGSPFGADSYAYDALNNLTTVTRGSNTFSYVYDIASNIMQTTYPDSTAVAAAYDNDERLASITSGNVTTGYQYDPASNLKITTLPSGNGFVETRSYDNAGRLFEVKNAKGATTLSDITYTLDPAGNPTKSVRSGGSSETDTYTYDNLSRLTKACFQLSCPNSSDPAVSWTYSDVGNRLTETRPSTSKTYTYNAADQLTQAGTTGYTYDQNGNEKTAGSTTFSYDLANRLVSTTTGTTTTTYTYDGLNKRLQASTGTQAAKKTNFLWDINAGLPQIGLERDGNNALIHRYVNGAHRISMTAGNKTYYFHHDPLGSVTNLTDSSGTTMWTDSYEPYGLIHSETKNSTQAPTAVIKFAGEYLDPTGLYHLRARQYDPSSGRFTTLDPLPNPVSDPYMSAYAYANDRPTVFTDPTGLRPDVCGSSIFRCWLKHDARHLGLVVIKVGGGCFVGGVTGEEALGGPLGLGLATVASPEVAVLLPAAGCIVGAFGAAVEEKTGYEGPSLTDPPVPLGQ